MKFGFVTCVQLGFSCMKEFYQRGGELDLVVTLPDDKDVNKSGRVYIYDFCNKHRITLLKSTNINNKEVIEVIRKKNIDWLFHIANCNVYMCMCEYTYNCIIIKFMQYEWRRDYK